MKAFACRALQKATCNTDKKLIYALTANTELPFFKHVTLFKLPSLTFLFQELASYYMRKQSSFHYPMCHFIWTILYNFASSVAIRGDELEECAWL